MKITELPESDSLCESSARGTSADEAYWYDPSLVELVRHDAPGDCRVALVTAFCGRECLLDKYLESVSRCSKAAGLYPVWLDNSGDEDFGLRLEDEFLNLFDGRGVLYRDRNVARPAEESRDYARIARYMADLYRYLLLSVPRSCEFTLCHEDDVVAPARGFQRLMDLVSRYPEIGTAVGNLRFRPLADRSRSIPLLWTFQRVAQFGRDWKVEVNQQEVLHSKPFGVEAVGAGHMGFWLTRTKLIHELGLQFDVDGLQAVDACWGYRLNCEGYRFVVDWSVDCQHWYEDESGQLDYV